MLAIPAIDIYKGKVTRLLKGDFAQYKFYNKTPLEYAKGFDSIGLPWLHIVDLEASLNGNISVVDQLREIKSSTSLKVQFGGGIKNFSNAETMINYGADRIIVGSISVTNKNEFEKILDQYNSGKIVVAVDVSEEIIYLKGWTEKSRVSLWDHLQYCTSLGINYFLCTDISRDGTLNGPNISLYKKIMDKYSNISLIASGGVGKLDDLCELKDSGIYASVVGKAFYENKITLEDLRSFVS